MTNPALINIPISMSELEDITGIHNLSYFKKGESVPKLLGYKDQKKVLLRYLDPTKMSTSRFWKELNALEELNKNRKKFYVNGFIIPKLVNNWPQKNLIATEFIEGKADVILTNSQITNYIEVMTDLTIDPSYNFRDGVYSKLNDLSLILPEFQPDFIELRDLVLENTDWDTDPKCLIHGDFHKLNLIRTLEGKIGIIDWEFATNGSIFFDLAMYEALSNHKFHEKYRSRISNWEKYVQLVLTQWYLCFYHNESRDNMKRLKKLKKMIQY